MNKYNIIPSVFLASLGLFAHAEENVVIIREKQEIVIVRDESIGQTVCVLMKQVFQDLDPEAKVPVVVDVESLETQPPVVPPVLQNPVEQKEKAEEPQKQEAKSNEEIESSKEANELEGAPISVKTRVIDHFIARLNGKPAGEIVENPPENPEKKPPVLPPPGLEDEKPQAPAAAEEQPAEEQVAEDAEQSMGYSWIISLIIVLISLGVLYYTRRVQATEALAAREKEENEQATDSEAEKEAVAPVETNPHDEQLQMIMELSKTAEDVNLEGLLLDRLEDIKAAYEHTQKWAIECIGLIDEIRVMRNAYKGNDGEVLDVINSVLRAQLEERDCEILNSDTWNPDIQRAIKIDRVLPKGSPKTIVAKYASGLKIAGSLIRKQEVVLEQEKPDDF